MKKPWLSVLVPTCDGEAFLARALESVRRAGDGVECLAVDDGSSDATPRILEEYSRRMPLIVIARGGSARRGWSANANLALSKASGEFSCILHQDDFWLEGRSEFLRRTIGEHPRADFILHAARFVDEKERSLGVWRCPLPELPRQAPVPAVFERLLVQCFVPAPAATFRTRAAREAGGLDEALWMTPDWDLWLKIVENGSGVVYGGRPFAAFRIHRASQTVVRSADAAAIRAQLDAVLDRHLAGARLDPARKAKIADTARFSNDFNVALAGWFHRGGSEGAARLAARFLTLGPGGWRRYLRDSRIVERVSARLRARLRPAS